MRLMSTVRIEAADVMATKVTSLIYFTHNKVEAAREARASAVIRLKHLLTLPHFTDHGGVLANPVEHILVP